MESAEKKKADIGAPHSSHVDISFRHAQIIDRKKVDQRRKKGEYDQDEPREELGHDDLQLGERFGKDHFDGARSFLFCKKPHSDGRDKEKENERGDHEKPVEIGITEVQDVEIPGEDPQEQPVDEQEYRNHDISRQGTQK